MPQQAPFGPPAPTKKVRRWPLAVGTGIAGFVLGIGMSAGGSSDAAPTTVTVPQSAPQSPQAETTTEAPPVVVEGYTEGVYEVGVDMQPGKYKTAGPDPDDAFPNCYYARLKTGDGSLGDIIDNNNSQGPVTVTVKTSDGMFDTSGCQAWVKVS
jgi:hypothetical protein